MGLFGPAEITGSLASVQQKLSRDEGQVRKDLEQLEQLSTEVPALTQGIKALSQWAEDAVELQKLLKGNVTLSKDRSAIHDGTQTASATWNIKKWIAELTQARDTVKGLVETNTKARSALKLELKEFGEAIVEAKLAIVHLKELLRKHDVEHKAITTTSAKRAMMGLGLERNIPSDPEGAFKYAVRDAEYLFKLFDQLHQLNGREITNSEVVSAIDRVQVVFKDTYGTPDTWARALFESEQSGEMTESAWRNGIIRMDMIERLNLSIYQILEDIIRTIDSLRKWATENAESSSSAKQVREITTELYSLTAGKLIVRCEDTDRLVERFSETIKSLEEEAGAILLRPHEDLTPMLAKLRAERMRTTQANGHDASESL